VPRYDRKRFWEKPSPKKQPHKWWGVVQDMDYEAYEVDFTKSWNSFFKIRTIITYRAVPYSSHYKLYIEEKFTEGEAKALAAIMNAGRNENDGGS